MALFNEPHGEEPEHHHEKQHEHGGHEHHEHEQPEHHEQHEAVIPVHFAQEQHVQQHSGFFKIVGKREQPKNSMFKRGITED